VTRDDVFDSVLEAESAPHLPRLEFGRTLPFVKARVPLAYSPDFVRLVQADRVTHVEIVSGGKGSVLAK